MFGKIVAGVVMAIPVFFLCAIVFGIGTGGGEGGGQRGLWAGLIGAAIMFVLALMAQRGRYAWGRGFLVCGLLCFAMPVAAVVFTGILGAQSVGQAGGEAGRAGAALGTAIGGGIVTFISGVLGFFLGIMFLIGAYFSLRAPRVS